MLEPLIEVKDLRYRYAAPNAGWILQDLNLRVEPGEYLLIAGASGSGKSTLCRTFNGLIPHFHGGVMGGRVRVAGLCTREHPVAELVAYVGMIFQNPAAQLFTNTVAREIAFGLESLGLERSEIGARLEESAEAVGIGHLLERNPNELSGGEQQLTAIAAALSMRPQALVLDEPYASLDRNNIHKVRAALRRCHRHGTTIIVTEHRLQHVMADADRMVVLRDGHIALEGPVRQVLGEDLGALALEPPPVVRVARAMDLKVTPLSVDELLTAAEGTPLPAGLLPQAVLGGASEDAAVLVVERVRFRHGSTDVLRNVSLTVRPGECLALVGRNGSGKTTLIKHFNALHRPDRGCVLVLGQDTRSARTSRLARHVGMAFQDPNAQFFKLQVREEIEVGARALGSYDPAWQQELVALLGLEPLLDRSPYRLSEGEKKRVAFAAALAGQPEILVLDEPTTGQDWPFRQTLGRVLGDLRARGQTIIMATHDLEFAEQHAGRWALLCGGELLADGHPSSVMGDEATMRLAGLEPTDSFLMAQALGMREK